MFVPVMEEVALCQILIVGEVVAALLDLANLLAQADGIVNIWNVVSFNDLILQLGFTLYLLTDHIYHDHLLLKNLKKYFCKRGNPS